MVMHVYEICMYLLSTCGVAFRISALKADADVSLVPVIAILTAKCYFGLKAQCFTYTSERKLSRMLYHVKLITVLFFLDLRPNISSYGFLHVSVKWERLY